MKNYIKRAGTILFTLIFMIVNMGVFAAAEGTDTRKTEGQFINIYETGYGIGIRKTDKNGERLSGSVFQAYRTDASWDMDTAAPLEDSEGVPGIQIYPDKDTGNVRDASNGAVMYIIVMEPYLPKHLIIRELTAPDGYEHETDKLYYMTVEKTAPGEFMLKIAPQSQTDAYISDDGYLVLENASLEVPVQDPMEEPAEQPVQEPAEEPADEPEMNQPNAVNINEDAGQNDSQAGTELPETADDFSAGIVVVLLVLSGTAFGILCIRKFKNRNQM